MADNKWQHWLESEEGKKAIEPSILKSPDQQEFLKNRLWWAFNAGNFPITGRLETKGENLLKRVAELEGVYIPVSLRRAIKEYVK